MNRLKFWLEQTMTISFAILVGIILEGVVYLIFRGQNLEQFSLSWIQLLSIVLTGAVWLAALSAAGGRGRASRSDAIE